MMDANAALTAELKSVHTAVTKAQADQQSLVAGPLEKLKIIVDDTSADVSGIAGGFGTMRTRQEKMEGVLNDLAVQMKLVLQQTEHAQPATPVSAVPSSADAVALLFAAAESEKLAGNSSFALQSLGEISQKYPDSPYAPIAMFEIGSLYAENEQYGEALEGLRPRPGAIRRQPHAQERRVPQSGAASEPGAQDRRRKGIQQLRQAVPRRRSGPRSDRKIQGTLRPGPGDQHEGEAARTVQGSYEVVLPHADNDRRARLRGDLEHDRNVIARDARRHHNVDLVASDESGR